MDINIGIGKKQADGLRQVLVNGVAVGVFRPKTDKDAESGSRIELYVQTYTTKYIDREWAQLLEYADELLFFHSGTSSYFDNNRTIYIDTFRGKGKHNVYKKLYLDLNRVLDPTYSIYIYHYVKTLFSENAFIVSTNLNLSNHEAIKKDILNSLDIVRDLYISFELPITQGHTLTELGSMFHMTESICQKKALESMNLLISNYDATNLINNNQFVRSIEFKPEDFHTGVNILNYFGSYLTQQYPDQNAHVTIGQQGRQVTLTVQTDTGDTDVIVRAFDEYGMIMSGSQPPNKYVNDPVFIAKLENKIELLNAELNAERRLTNLQASTISKLIKTVQSSVANPHPIHILNSNTNTTSITLSIQNEISSISNTLDEIIQELDKSQSLREELSKLKEELELLKNEPDKSKIQASSAFKKLGELVSKINKGMEFTENIFATGKKGMELVYKLAPHFDHLQRLIGQLPG